MILTISEARAEALTVLAKVMLKRFSLRERCALYELVRNEGECVGDEAISGEIAGLFEDVPQAEVDLEMIGDHG